MVAGGTTWRGNDVGSDGNKPRAVAPGRGGGEASGRRRLVAQKSVRHGVYQRLGRHGTRVNYAPPLEPARKHRAGTPAGSVVARGSMVSVGSSRMIGNDMDSSDEDTSTAPEHARPRSPTPRTSMPHRDSSEAEDDPVAQHGNEQALAILLGRLGEFLDNQSNKEVDAEAMSSLLGDISRIAQRERHVDNNQAHSSALTALLGDVSALQGQGAKDDDAEAELFSRMAMLGDLLSLKKKGGEEGAMDPEGSETRFPGPEQEPPVKDQPVAPPTPSVELASPRREMSPSRPKPNPPVRGARPSSGVPPRVRTAGAGSSTELQKSEAPPPLRRPHSAIGLGTSRRQSTLSQRGATASLASQSELGDIISEDPEDYVTKGDKFAEVLWEMEKELNETREQRDDAVTKLRNLTRYRNEDAVRIAREKKRADELSREILQRNTERKRLADLSQTLAARCQQRERDARDLDADRVRLLKENRVLLHEKYILQTLLAETIAKVGEVGGEVYIPCPPPKDPEGARLESEVVAHMKVVENKLQDELRLAQKQIVALAADNKELHTRQAQILQRYGELSDVLGKVGFEGLLEASSKERRREALAERKLNRSQSPTRSPTKARSRQLPRHNPSATPRTPAARAQSAGRTRSSTNGGRDQTRPQTARPRDGDDSSIPVNPRLNRMHYMGVGVSRSQLPMSMAQISDTTSNVHALASEKEIQNMNKNWVSVFHCLNKLSSAIARVDTSEDVERVDVKAVLEERSEMRTQVSRLVDASILQHEIEASRRRIKEADEVVRSVLEEKKIQKQQRAEAMARAKAKQERERGPAPVQEPSGREVLTVLGAQSRQSSEGNRVGSDGSAKNVPRTDSPGNTANDGLEGLDHVDEDIVEDDCADVDEMLDQTAEEGDLLMLPADSG